MDYIFFNGKIYNNYNIESVLVKGEDIAYTGSLFESKKRANNPVLIDLKGKLLLPALTDAHTHFVETAKHLLTLNVLDCYTADIFYQKLCNYRDNQQHNLPWITGYGWEKKYFQRFPEINKSMLDKVFPDIPVSIASKDLHANLCNTKALQVAGISASKSYDGVVLGKTADGQLNGFLYEQSWTLLAQFIPKLDTCLQQKLIKQLVEKSWEFGLCGTHSFEDLNSAILAKHISEQLPFYFTWYYLDQRDKCNFLTESKRFLNGGIKLFSDGSMGSDTAWMFEKDNHKDIDQQLSEIENTINKADEQAIQVAVHAIGDLAVNRIAQIFKETYQNSKTQIQHRIEHLQAVRPEDMKLLKQANIHASMQLIHLKDDIAMIKEKWQQAQHYAFPLKSINDNKINLALGSDSPVETMNPFCGMYSALFRKQDNQTLDETFLPKECLDIKQVIDAYAVNHFRVANKNIRYGKFMVGLKANLIIVQDFLANPNDILLDTKPVFTMIDGQVVYSQNNI